jgi:hypothetical protein
VPASQPQPETKATSNFEKRGKRKEGETVHEDIMSASFVYVKEAQSLIEVIMTRIATVLVVGLISGAALVAQERKPVPKNSARVTIPGCTKGYIFTASRRTPDEPGSVDIPPGMHLRMNGPKSVMAEIKSHEGSMIAITGIMKKSQLNPTGVGIGGGVTIAPGADPTAGRPGNPLGNQIVIDVEGWRPAVGECPR